MKFGAGQNLFWLWALIALFGFLWWAFFHRKQQRSLFASEELFAYIAKSYDLKCERLRSFFFILVVVFSIFALARPQWGYEVREIKRWGTDILLLVDVSRSMLTRDVKPSRLERTKLAVKDLIKKLKGDRLGLIVFSGDAFLMCPLTVDYGGFLLSLEDLRPGAVSRGGTNISAAIKEALRGCDAATAKFRAVIIVTDGENLEDDPMPWVEQAKQKGIKIFTVGVGTPQGELVEFENEKGEKDFLKDSQGNFVKSRLNEQLLQHIALKTGGVYVRASAVEFGLDLIYEREISKFEKTDFQSKSERRYFERFQFPLAAALLFLILEMTWAPRKKDDEL